MENLVYDYNFHKIGYLEKIDYLSYVDKLYECGSFSITCPAVQQNIDILKPGNIVYFEHDIAGIVQSVYYRQESSRNLEVSGNLMDTILDWRYIYPTVDLYNVSPHVFMQECVKRNFINCTAARKFPNFECADVSISGLEPVTKQQTGDSVLEFMIEFAPTYSIGFHVGFSPSRKKYTFSVVPGADHTIGNTVGNKKFIFSDDLNNILSCGYTKTTEEYRNTALVAGERGDETRVILQVLSTPTEQTGWNRRELYVDARDLQSSKEVTVKNEQGEDETETVEMTDAEYNAVLKNRGLEKLAENVEIEAFEAEVNNNFGSQFVYKRDYNLGDKVTAIKKDLGIFVNAQITEIEVTYDSSGYTVTPTVGNPILSLYSKLRRRGI